VRSHREEGGLSCPAQRKNARRYRQLESPSPCANDFNAKKDSKRFVQREKDWALLLSLMSNLRSEFTFIKTQATLRQEGTFVVRVGETTRSIGKISNTDQGGNTLPPGGNGVRPDHKKKISVNVKNKRVCSKMKDTGLGRSGRGGKG